MPAVKCLNKVTPLLVAFVLVVSYMHFAGPIGTATPSIGWWSNWIKGKPRASHSRKYSASSTHSPTGGRGEPAAIRGTSRAVQAPIKRGTLLYLVLGQQHPAERWLGRSKWKDVALLYMSWKVDVTRSLKQLVSNKFKYVFFPNSTWATCRNKQAAVGHQWEVEQNWRFEYYVYFDEDVKLAYRTAEDPSKVVKDDDKGFRQLNRLLLHDRPMKAGIGFDEFPWNAGNLACLRRCQADNVVAAYHASASDFLEPYSLHFDKSNWWLSAYMFNMRASAIGSEHCANYEEVLVDNSAQDHGSYPRSLEQWNDAIQFVYKCLAHSNFSDFKQSASMAQMSRRLETSLSREPRGPPQCHRNPADVDFSQVLQLRSRNWPKDCG